MEPAANQKQSSKQPSKNKKSPNKFLRFTALGFQMLATIAIGYGIGYFLDKNSASEDPIWTMILTLVFSMIAIYLAVRDVIKMSKEEEEN